MALKAEIIGKLGEDSLLLPRYVNDGLLANDRVKYYLTLLQAAAAHAQSDQTRVPELRSERLAAGEKDASLDSVPVRSELLEGEQLSIPRIGTIYQRILDGVAQMLRPLKAASDEGGDMFAAYDGRLKRLTETAPGLADDRVPSAYIAALTNTDRGAGDSFHLLVMDLHKALNRLQATIAQESIRGAEVYGIEDHDRTLIEAFQDGVNSTAPLKFDHPGLGTTATRAGGRLIIQNDIGTTDAHVLVVRVEDLVATVTYTDVHLPRLRFFESLFADYPVRWQSTQTDRAAELADGENFYTGTGCLEAATRDQLGDYLRFLGSRIVFLIDWNKARKRLRRFVGKRDAVALLTWAAQENVGHRAFLELGGEEMIYDAIRHSAGLTVQYGESLEALLGEDALLSYLRFVLRTAGTGLAEGRPANLIRDEIKAELLRQFHSVQEILLDLAARQTELIFDLACTVRDGLLCAPVAPADRRLPNLARRATAWEHQADDLVRRSNELTRARPVPDALAALVPKGDDIADSLEEAAFLLGLLPQVPQEERVLVPTRELSELLVGGARELVKCVADAALIRRGAARDDVHDFLEAVNRVVVIEQETDAAQRRVTECLVHAATDARQLHVFSELVRSLEKAADEMAHNATKLRDYALAEAIAT